MSSWVIPLAGVLNFLLGLIVWLRKPREPLYYGFFIFALSTVVSISLDFVFRFYPTIFFLQCAYAAATFMPLTLLMWVLELCGIPTRSFSFWRKLLVFVPTGIVFILCFQENLIVKSIDHLTILGYQGQLGTYFPIYSGYFMIYLVTMFFLLHRKYKKSTDLEKNQILFVTTGIMLYSISGLLFSLILPTVFHIFDYTLLDAPSLIFFIALTAYAILRFKLLNIKVIATELLVFLLFIFTIIQIVVAQNLEERLINSALLFLIIIAGTFLIRSVLREVEQREKIELLAKDLEAANERLKELDQQKSEFVSLASHQLRGPLTAIKGYASLILEGDFGEVPGPIKEAVDKIFKSTQALVVLVGDYLDVSRIEQGRMQYDFSVFDFKELAKTVVDEMKPVVDKASLNMTFDFNVNETYTIKADQGKIKQVIANLIDNSIKYTPKGWVKVALTKKNPGNLLELTIQDTGVGIRPEVLPRLFEKFTRAPDASKTNIMGTGLGLYVAKKMIEAHNGKVWAESPGDGKGSTFHIELQGA